jgi:ADP-heptose:LPS heptosyltransferase
MRDFVQNNWTDLIWLQTAFIGDVVLTTGAITLAAKKFPGVRQHVISTAAGCEVLKGSRDLVERFSFSKKESVYVQHY